MVNVGLILEFLGKIVFWIIVVMLVFAVIDFIFGPKR